MLDKKTMPQTRDAAPRDWTYSPLPAVERAIAEVRQKCPPMMPTGLGRLLSLLDKLGAPQRRLPPVVHVPRTHGKGPTLAFMQAVFESAGLSVHKFTSPHLVRFEERIVVAGKEISSDALLD